MRITSLYLSLMAILFLTLGVIYYLKEPAEDFMPYFIFGGVTVVIALLIEFFSWYSDWRLDQAELNKSNLIKEDLLDFKKDESKQIDFLVKVIQGKESILNFDQNRFSREFYQQSETILVHNNLKRRKARNFISFLTGDTLLQIIPREQALVLSLKLRIYQLSNSTLNSFLSQMESEVVPLGAIPSKVHELPSYFLKKFLKADLINLMKQQEWNFFLKEGKTIEQYFQEKEEEDELKNSTK